MIYSTDLAKIKHHLALTCTPTLADMMLPQLIKHGIKVFHFNRQYDDGSIIRLSTDAKWNEHYFTQGYINKRKKVPAEYLTKTVNYFVWLTKTWPEMLTDAAINFDIANGISIVEKCNGYIDNFCFGSSVKNTSIVNFYVNHLDLLYQYGIEFRVKAKHLLNKYESNKIILPEKIIETSSFIQQNISELRLTAREKQCAMQLIAGKRIKEIAVKLDLSPRTVEFYLNNLKDKLDCRDKIELTIKLRDFFAKI